MLHLKNRSFKVVCGMAVAACLLFAGQARADVTIKQTAETTGLGGFLNSETKTVCYIQKDKKCDESETKMTNKLMKFMGAGKPVKTASVIDLEKGMILNIDHQAKTCTEMPLEKITELTRQGMGQSAEGQPDTESSGSAFDTSRVTLSPPKIDYQVTGKEEVIAGHACKQGILTMEIEGVDNETGEKFKLITVVDAMLAKDVAGLEEYNQFNQNLVARLGFEWDASNTQPLLSSMGAYGIDPEKLGEEAAKMEGFPFVQIFTLRGEGSQFAPPKPEEETEAETEEGETGGNDVATKALQGLFGGKDKDKDKDKDKGEKQDWILRVVSRVTEISGKGIKQGQFDAPKGYEYLRPYAKE
jgi:hypothetical protein